MYVCPTKGKILLKSEEAIKNKAKKIIDIDQIFWHDDVKDQTQSRVNARSRQRSRYQVVVDNSHNE